MTEQCINPSCRKFFDIEETDPLLPRIEVEVRITCPYCGQRTPKKTVGTLRTSKLSDDEQARLKNLANKGGRT